MAADRSRERRAAWEAAVPRAHVLYAESVNRTRLDTQVQAWLMAESYTRYAAALNDRAADEPDPHAAADIARWAEWANKEAQRLNPLASASTLKVMEPPKPAASDLDKFMPKGMTVWRPPD